jgi:hypothetical protein
VVAGIASWSSDAAPTLAGLVDHHAADRRAAPGASLSATADIARNIPLKMSAWMG